MTQQADPTDALDQKVKDDALELRKGGASYPAIAQALGLENEKAAIDAVVAGLEAALSAPVSSEQLDHERLDGLILSAWPDAKRGDKKSIDQVLRILSEREKLRRRAEKADEVDEAQALEKLPEWVPIYLAAWGSVDPDGKKMRVGTAAELAGTTAANVRMLRKRSPQFKRLEWMARQGNAQFAASFVEAGLRGMMPAILRAFADLVRDRDGPTVRQAMQWLSGKAAKVELQPGEEPLTIQVIGGVDRDDV